MYITIDEMQRLINLIRVKNDILATGNEDLIKFHKEMIDDFEKTYNITVLNDCINFNEADD